MERESLGRIAMVIRLQNLCFEQAAPGIVYFQKSSEILAGENLKNTSKVPRLAFQTVWFRPKKLDKPKTMSRHGITDSWGDHMKGATIGIMCRNYCSAEKL